MNEGILEGVKIINTIVEESKIKEEVDNQQLNFDNNNLIIESYKQGVDFYFIKEDIRPFIIYSPNGNCQVYSIGNFNTLLFYNPLDFLEYIDRKWYSKKQLLIDINEHNISKLEEKFPNLEKHIVFKQDYTSTNSSPMRMYLIKVKDLINDKG